jgi:TP901 family phage tail tape measure protein
LAKKFSLETVLSLTDGITAPIKKAEAKMVGFSKNIKKHFGGFGKDIMKVDKALNKGIAVAGAAAFAALGAAIVVATKQYIEFEQAIVQAGAKFKDLDVTSETYADSLKALGAEARRVAAVTEFMATDTAGALDKMAMAGLSSELSIALLAGTTDLATSAGTDLTTAVDIATDALGAFGLMTNDAAQATINLTRISDVFAKTTTTANTDLTMLFEAAKSGAASFTAAGQSIETFSALAGIMANSGVKGSEAGTSLRNVMLRLADATPEAAKVMKKLGVQTQDSRGNFRDVVDILADFEKGLVGMGTAQRTAALSTVFGARAVTGVNILLQSGTKELRKYRGELEASGGAAEAMAGAMRKSIKNQIEVLKSGLMEKGLQFVEAFSERGSAALEKITDYIQNLDIGPIIDFAEKALDVLINVFTFIGENWETILLMVGAFKALTTAIALFNAVSMASPWMLIAGGVAAVAIAIKAIVDNWSKIKEWWKGAGNKNGAASDEMYGATYAEPSTYASESRSYSETTSTSEVFVRPDKGTSISPTRGGAPAPVLSYGRAQ